MILLFFIFGLLIGSFLNVVIHRLDSDEGIFLSRSMCPKCKKQINWYDNLPLLSFFLLRGKCRECKRKISWMYPAVELMTGTVFAVIGKIFLQSGERGYMDIAFAFLFFSILIILFVYDFKHLEIPMVVLWIGVFITVLYLIFSDKSLLEPVESLFEYKTVSGLFAGLVAFSFFFAISFYSRETWMGYGDAYVGLLIGLFLGWPLVLAALMLSFIVGAFWGIFLIAGRQKTMKSQLPFAPFLVIGTFLALVLPGIFPSLSYYLFYF